MQFPASSACSLGTAVGTGLCISRCDSVVSGWHSFLLELLSAKRNCSAGKPLFAPNLNHFSVKPSRVIGKLRVKIHRWNSFSTYVAANRVISPLPKPIIAFAESVNFMPFWSWFRMFYPIDFLELCFWKKLYINEGVWLLSNHSVYTENPWLCIYRSFSPVEIIETTFR